MSSSSPKVTVDFDFDPCEWYGLEFVRQPKYFAIASKDWSPPRTESVEPISTEGRLVVTGTGNQWRGLALRYWCSSPEEPLGWRCKDYRSTLRHFPIYESQAVVLTAAESDIPVGKLSRATLSSMIGQFWGGILPQSVAASDLYSEWLSYFIRHNLDFGVVHAWVSALREWARLQWMRADEARLCVSYSHSYKVPEPSEIELRAPDTYINNEDGEVLAGLVAPSLGRRIQSLDGGKAIHPDSDRRPRRVWDVCANRVVPAAWLPREILDRGHMVLLSHAWVAPNERKYIITNVNLRTWPVPMPYEVEIEDVRRDLLLRNVRYAWLDILCLRQEMEPIPGFNAGLSEPFSLGTIHAREQLRNKEWESDVPLIGALYRQPQARVLVYLSGVGRAFRAGDWRNERHWLRRVWTLQETHSLRRLEFAGVRGVTQHPLECTIDERGQSLRQILEASCFAGQLHLEQLILQIKDRCYSNPVDQVGALLYFCLHKPDIPSLARPLPVYHSEEDPETAWIRLVRAASCIQTTTCACCHFYELQFAVQLMELFPYPSAEHWFPSWTQLMRYPDIFLQEPQLPDWATPRIDGSLRIYGGHLYREVTLNKAVTSKGDIVYTATATGTDGQRCSVLLARWCRRSYRSASTDLHLDLPIESNTSYALLDLTPHVYLRPNRHVDLPANSVHSLVVCKELTPLREIDPAGDAYQYRLRRVTSLQWDSSLKVETLGIYLNDLGGARPARIGWLPFRADLKGSFTMMEGRWVNFWDPSIVVTLQ